MRIYTDGANKGNGKENSVGGWGFIVTQHDKLVDSEVAIARDTTNNRMELAAVMGALLYCISKGIESPVIVTDSEYVQKGITEWIIKWEKNGWKTADKKPVKNQDLWQDFRTLEKTVKPIYEWVKGHAESKWNIECDEMINKFIKNNR